VIARAIGRRFIGALVPAVIALTGCASDPPQPFDSNATVNFLDRIDDLDDGDDSILALGFRVGFWYTFNDATAGGAQTPAGTLFATTPGGPSGTGYCAHTFGSGFTVWGAGMGLDLNNTGEVTAGTTPTTGTTGTAVMPSTRLPYDASAYKGVAFSARGNAPMRFAVSTVAVENVAAGGTCVGGGTNPACADTHGVTIPLTSEWRTYSIPFDRLTQEGFGLRVPFDVTTTIAFYFSTSEGTFFDFSIDDVGFFR
jgi:hypothetical protein